LRIDALSRPSRRGLVAPVRPGGRRGGLFLHLARPQLAELPQVDALRRIDHLVAKALDLAAELPVSSDRPEPNEGQSFVGVRRASARVVGAEAFQAAGEGSSRAIRPQAEIDMENA